MNLLASATPELVRTTPYPHLIMHEVLPADQVARLLEQFPSLATITGSRTSANNERHSYAAHQALTDPGISSDWKHILTGQLNQGFLDRFLFLFGGAIRQRFPHFTERFGATLPLRAGMRRRDGFSDADVLLEAQICVNTPVTAASSVRGPHIDMPDKLFAGLFYLRHPDDDSRGGDLELHRYRAGSRCLHGQFIDDRDVEVVDTVRYQSNVLVLFLNDFDAIHGVTPRQPTPYPRLFLNLFGELQRPLFDLNHYQADQSLIHRAHYRMLMGQKRLVRGLRGWSRAAT